MAILIVCCNNVFSNIRVYMIIPQVPNPQIYLPTKLWLSLNTYVNNRIGSGLYDNVAFKII